MKLKREVKHPIKLSTGGRQTALHPVLTVESAALLLTCILSIIMGIGCRRK